MISVTGWTFEYIDGLIWPQLMQLFKYWRKHPPLHILVQGIASGMAGKLVGEDDSPPEPRQHVQSADEIMSALMSAGIPVGVIQNG